VNRQLRRLLDDGGGLVHRADLLVHLPEHAVDHAVRRGRLQPLCPQVYRDPAVELDSELRTRAALGYARGLAALSHTSALAVWGLPVPAGGPVHLVTAPSARLRGTRGIRIHRRDGFAPEPPHVVVRAGYPVTRLETTLVDTWPLLTDDAQRAPVISAVARRLTTPERIDAALVSAPRLGGRRRLVELVGKLRAGCRSELELWGYERIFATPDLAGLRWQVPVPLGRRVAYLDLFDERARVNFELDGTKYHAGPADRERDLRRDAALAVKGITVVRFTHDRLVREPHAVRAQVRAILAARGIRPLAC
jgi:very-short-patch-repair endonuclease